MNFTAPSPVRRAEGEIATLLAACIDYHNLLLRRSVPDSVTGRDELQAIYDKYNVKLEPRSLYGEAPRR